MGVGEEERRIYEREMSSLLREYMGYCSCLGWYGVGERGIVYGLHDKAT